MSLEILRNDFDQFYALLHDLEQTVGGKRHLINCDGKMYWPDGGIYFFFENDECRNGQPGEPRVVRVGTHALTSTSKSTLWGRLKQHKGSNHGGGNHRGSVFRLHVGAALIEKYSCHSAYPNWGIGSSATRPIVDSERQMECRVSDYIGQMPFLWLAVDTPELRAHIERNAIALLSGVHHTLDPQSSGWLGNKSTRPAIRVSGLWNVNHVSETYDRTFIADMRTLVKG